MPRATGYHPAALDELLLEQLLRKTAQPSLGAFCRHALQGGPPALMRRVLKEGGFDERTEPLRVADDAARLRRLARLFRDVNCFAPPDASGLAPVGEYNLRLGVEKEVRPTYVATACSPVAAHEGHAFVVEAAVSVGGLREEEEGLRVYRFANRIPLLFEGGADVATIVAKKRVRWAAYKIDVKKERVGVFVSLVSTKIPFKGTSKEYVGEDAHEIHDAIRECLMACGSQLKAQLAKRDLHQRDRDRRKNLLRYVPDVAAALCGVLQTDEDALKKALQRHVDRADLEAVADDGGAPRARVDMRRRAVVRDVVSTRFALRLFAPRGAASRPPDEDEEAEAEVAPKRKRPRAAWTGVIDDDDGGDPAASPPPAAAAAARADFEFDDDDDDDDVLAIDGLSPSKGAPPSAGAPRSPARSRLGRGDGLAVADSSSDGDSSSSEDVPLASLAPPPPNKRPRPLPAPDAGSSDDSSGDEWAA